MSITVQQFNLNKNIWAFNTGQHLSQSFIPNLNEFLPPNSTFAGIIPISSISWDINTSSEPAYGLLGRSRSATKTPWYQNRTNDNYALNINYPYSTLNISGPALLFYDDLNNFYADTRWLEAIYCQLSYAMGSYNSHPFAITSNNKAPWWEQNSGYGFPYAKAKIVLEKLSLELSFTGAIWSMNFKIWGKNAAENIMNSFENNIQLETVHARKAQWYNFQVNLNENLIETSNGPESLGYSILPTKLSINWNFKKEEKWELNSTVLPYNNNIQTISPKYSDDPPITLYKKLITSIDISGYLNPWKSNQNSINDAQNIAKVIAQMGPHDQKAFHNLNSIQILFHNNINILDYIIPVVSFNGISNPYINFNTFKVMPETNGIVTVDLNGIIVHPFVLKEN